MVQNIKPMFYECSECICSHLNSTQFKLMMDGGLYLSNETKTKICSITEPDLSVLRQLE